jgi:uncharacterized protein
MTPERINMENAPLNSSLLIKPVSADCNLSCDYCFYLEKAALYPQAKTHRMSQKVLEALISQAMQHTAGPVRLAWQGGEPTLAGLDFFMQVVELEMQYARPGQIVGNALQTNGILLNEAWAEFLCQYKFLIGLSLDGPAELHDHYRRTKNQRASFSLVYPKIELLRQYGVAFNVLMVINAVTVNHPHALYHFLVENRIDFVQFIPAVETDKNGKPAPFSMPAEKYGDFLCIMFDLWYNGGKPRFSERMFEAFLSQLLAHESDLCLFRKSCDSYLVVEANGDVYACDFFVEPAWKIGNLLEQPLRQLERAALRQQFAANKSALPAACRSCEWKKYCYGGCPKYRVMKQPNYMCAGYKKFFGHSIPYLRDLARRLSAPQDVAISRNQLCPCGSGKKYKRCCG